MPAWDVIEMATVNGARALGRDDTGVLAVGKAVDLCVVDLDRPHLMPASDIPSLIVHSMRGGDVSLTMVDGEIVYERGEFMRINRPRAEFDFRTSLRRLGI
jgi:5-methylthioadenosine/S-adenosylhomocysteine deaminase